jgi:hypothetical protein
VQNEITDLTSAKSSELYTLLWVVRQLDRAVSRILNVQLDISEVCYQCVVVLHTVLLVLWLSCCGLSCRGLCLVCWLLIVPSRLPPFLPSFPSISPTSSISYIFYFLHFLFPTFFISYIFYFLHYFQLHTILPDSSGLAVASVPQAVQLPLRTVVSTLRTQPALLADTLLRAGNLPSSHSLLPPPPCALFPRLTCWLGYLAVDQDRSFKSTYPIPLLDRLKYA